MCGSWYFPRFLFRGVLYTDEHSLLDGPGMAVDFLMHNVELVGVHGVSCGGVWGEGALKCSLTLSPNVLPDSPMYALGQLLWRHW